MPATKSATTVQPVSTEKKNKINITLKDYLTASGRYPERENHKEVTEEVRANAAKLLFKLNSFLNEPDLELTSVKVSSGFRPSEVNANTPGAAKKSLHMSGMACDLSDMDGKLDELVGDDKHDHLLKKYGLWHEDPASTKGWCHLDIKDRGKRPKNRFKP